MSRTDVLAAWRAQLAAMDAGDADALAACFTADAHLVHMTGTVQPLEDWMRGVRRGDFVYHEVIDQGAQVTLRGEDAASLVGRAITGHRSDGSGQAWPLRMEQDYVRRDGAWLCRESRVTLARG